MDTRNIGDLIRLLVKGESEIYSIPCEVVSISDENLAELKPLNNDANLLEVKLIAGAAEFPILIKPVIGSVVIASFLSKNTAFISLYSEVETVYLRGDEFGGLIKIDELVNNLDKLTARVDGIIDGIKNAVPIPQDGGAGLQTTINAALAGLIDKEDFTQLENENVKHG